MRLLSFQKDQDVGFGAVKGDGVVDLSRRMGLRSLRALLESGTLADAAAIVARESADFPLAGIRFLPPIPDPDKIICVGLNYRDHVAETGRTITEKPTLFSRFAASQVGHGAAMLKPAFSDKLDFEGEVAIVIGTAGRHIRQEDALRHVAGYSCYNDGSVRDWQYHTSQFLPGKNFVATGGFGPWLVTSDEIPDPTVLTLTTRLNGMVVQRATVDMMITSIPAQIAYISTFTPLVPGDVIVTGTPGGVGARRDPPLFMKDGDVVEVEVDAVGILRNPIETDASTRARPA